MTPHSRFSHIAVLNFLLLQIGDLFLCTLLEYKMDYLNIMNLYFISVIKYIYAIKIVKSVFMCITKNTRLMCL